MLSRKQRALSRLHMEIIDFRYARLGAWWRASHICSPFTRIYMVTEGTGYLQCRDQSITMTPGNIYVIPAGLRFSYSCEEGFSKTYFHICLPLPNGSDLFEGIDKCLCFSDPEAVTAVTGCLHSDELRDIIRIRAVLYDLVFRCVEHSPAQAPGSYSDHIVKAMEYIEANLSFPLSAGQVADALLIPPERLRKTFRAETGIPMGKYIHNRLMAKAELEVRRGEFSVQEISQRLGFCDQFYFSRCFSKEYGLSPVKYRQKVNPHQ